MLLNINSTNETLTINSFHNHDYHFPLPLNAMDSKSKNICMLLQLVMQYGIMGGHVDLYDVRCIGGTNRMAQPCIDPGVVYVKIVDYCPPGCRGTINLSRKAFEVIGNLDAGRIRVNYEQ